MKKSFKTLLIILLSSIVIAVIGFAIKEQYDAYGRGDESRKSFDETISKQRKMADSLAKYADSLRILNNTYRSTLSESKKKEYDLNAKKIDEEVSRYAKHLSDSMDRALLVK